MDGWTDEWLDGQILNYQDGLRNYILGERNSIPKSTIMIKNLKGGSQRWQQIWEPAELERARDQKEEREAWPETYLSPSAIAYREPSFHIA